MRHSDPTRACPGPMRRPAHTHVGAPTLMLIYGVMENVHTKYVTTEGSLCK